VEERRQRHQLARERGELATRQCPRAVGRHDARRGAAQVVQAPTDVVYLDPMFPSRKKSALVNGPMQYLQQFLGEDQDAETLVQSALQSGAKRVVVKRPVTASAEGAAYSLEAKANRFDVYLL
jgi:16S rRNA (guanine1516-N2)-methyltransferase